MAFIKNAFKILGGHLHSASIQLSYIRIPKAASTSMSLVMLRSIYPALNNSSVNEKEINFLADVNLKLVIDSNSSNTYFTIVRNPFARLVSVYHDFFELEKSAFIYQDYLFEVLPQAISFTEFVNRISIIPDALKDQHIKPQRCFLKFYEQKNISITILKLEEAENITQHLQRYSLQLPHLNKSGIAYDYRNYYTLETLQKVSEIYQTDIEKFGYKKELTQLLEYTKSRKNI